MAQLEPEIVTQSSGNAAARDRFGRFFRLATYGGTVDEIRSHRATAAASVAAMSCADLAALLDELAPVMARWGDLQEAAKDEAKGRIARGEAVNGWGVQERMGPPKWDVPALAVALDTTQEGVKVRFSTRTPTVALVATKRD